MLGALSPIAAIAEGRSARDSAFPCPCSATKVPLRPSERLWCPFYLACSTRSRKRAMLPSPSVRASFSIASQALRHSSSVKSLPHSAHSSGDKSTASHLPACRRARANVPHSSGTSKARLRSQNVSSNDWIRSVARRLSALSRRLNSVTRSLHLAAPPICSDAPLRCVALGASAGSRAHLVLP